MDNKKELFKRFDTVMSGLKKSEPSGGFDKEMEARLDKAEEELRQEGALARLGRLAAGVLRYSVMPKVPAFATGLAIAAIVISVGVYTYSTMSGKADLASKERMIMDDMATATTSRPEELSKMSDSDLIKAIELTAKKLSMGDEVTERLKAEIGKTKEKLIGKVAKYRKDAYVYKRPRAKTIEESLKEGVEKPISTPAENFAPALRAVPMTITAPAVSGTGRAPSIAATITKPRPLGEISGAETASILTRRVSDRISPAALKTLKRVDNAYDVFEYLGEIGIIGGRYAIVVDARSVKGLTVDAADINEALKRSASFENLKVCIITDDKATIMGGLKEKGVAQRDIDRAVFITPKGPTSDDMLKAVKGELEALNVIDGTNVSIALAASGDNVAAIEKMMSLEGERAYSFLLSDSGRGQGLYRGNIYNILRREVNKTNATIARDEGFDKDMEEFIATFRQL
jgi:hypothetical protein